MIAAHGIRKTMLIVLMCSFMTWRSARAGVIFQYVKFHTYLFDNESHQVAQLSPTMTIYRTARWETRAWSCIQWKVWVVNIYNELERREFTWKAKLKTIEGNKDKFRWSFRILRILYYNSCGLLNTFSLTRQQIRLNAGVRDSLCSSRFPFALRPLLKYHVLLSAESKRRLDYFSTRTKETTIER